MSLAQALSAVDGQDLRGALDALLVAWRAHRAAAIADAVDLVSDALARELPKIEGKTRAAFQAQWLDVASREDPAELGPLLAVLDQEPCTQIRDRIDRLAVRPHDPRIARALVTFLGREPCPCTSTPNAPMWTQIWKLVTSLQDIRARATLQRQADVKPRGAFAELFQTRAARTLDALVEPAALSGADAAVLAQITKLAPLVGSRPAVAAPAKAIVDDELLQRIYDAPEDDAPRLVYADVLTARGEPRGELITLQCQPAGKPKSSAHLQREKALVREHGRRWLGPLEPVIGKDGLTYERGFVASCELAFKTKTQRAQLLRHPAWATVRRLVSPEAALLVPPSPLRALRELDGVTVGVLRQLAGVALPAISWARFRLEEGESLELAHVSAAFPRLGHGVIRLPKWAELGKQGWVFGPAWPRTLDALSVELLVGKRFPHLADCLPQLPAPVRTFVLDLLIDWRITASREGKRWRVVAEPLASFARTQTCRAVLAGVPERDVELLPIPVAKKPKSSRL